MNRFEIILEQSPWYVILCLLVAAAYSVLLYRKKHIWSTPVNRLLATARFLIVFILCFLLLVPMMRMLENLIEEPTIALVVDNSESMKGIRPDSIFGAAEAQLKEAGYQVVWNTLSGTQANPTDIQYDMASTNLNEALRKTELEYGNRNLIATVLISDGIHNTGFSPDNFTSYAPIYTIGIGDTTAIQDIAIQDVKYNKIAFSGNQFPVNVRVSQEGFSGQEVDVSILQAENVMASKKTTLTSSPFTEVEFMLNANGIGQQNYRIEVTPIEGEVSTQNNSRDIYINIVDNKERILILCAGPHPDVKAIRQALEVQHQIETVIYYPGYTKKPEGAFDVLIVHHFPTRKMRTDAVYEKYATAQIPTWYFVGNGTDLSLFNKISGLVEIEQKSSKNDEVSGVLNPQFSGFKINEESLNKLHRFPPVSVPFANYNFKRPSEHVLYQQIGNLPTEKPLLSFVRNTSGIRNAYFFGDGLWQWKINEFTLFDHNKGFNELVQKTVRYIATKNDRRKLRVNPVKEEFFTNEPVAIDIEVYNDIYEKIYQQKVELTVQNESGFSKPFTFVNDELKSRFSLGQLGKGVYSFTASTNVNGKVERDEREFLVKEQYLESLSLKADFDLLKRISANNSGKFYTEKSVNALTKELSETPHPAKIILVDEVLEEIIHQKWLFFVLMLLLTIEWATRKFSGDY